MSNNQDKRGSRVGFRTLSGKKKEKQRKYKYRVDNDLGQPKWEFYTGLRLENGEGGNNSGWKMDFVPEGQRQEWEKNKRRGFSVYLLEQVWI